MVLTNRNNNEIYIDLKQAKHMPKTLVDSLERELPRALKMVPAGDIINLAIQAATMPEIDRHDVSDALVQEVLAKQKDLDATIKQLQAVSTAKDHEISKLGAQLDAERNTNA